MLIDSKWNYSIDLSLQDRRMREEKAAKEEQERLEKERRKIAKVSIPIRSSSMSLLQIVIQLSL